MYDAAETIQQLYSFQDKVIRKKAAPDPNAVLQLDGNVWLTKEQLENVLVEAITDLEYDNFKLVMVRITSLPYAYRCKDFIEKYRKALAMQKKQARGDVTIRSPGTGNITINGKDITYFEDIQSREQVMFPLIFTEMQNRVDIECNVEGGGPSGQSGAIRWGIAWGLRSFVEKPMLERMQVAGLLTRDYRRRERKKPGQPGARKKPTWKKR
ncbi:Mitochondrial ribosomal protein S9 [Operophtera brumata]|uniref:Small ribosomal subunit protein uS9m n=1 Tax=Operophtera brumata TaxID=104452 RepID=A0A0L7LJP0_OPEBR|nr:Mitochondrial ribosomal protein S9 [Operophtera brumata]